MRARAGKPWPFAAAVLAASAFALAPAEADRYVRVDDRVAIGGQPTPAQLAELAVAGFRSVLNLREESECDTQPERLAAAAVRLAYCSVPISPANPQGRGRRGVSESHRRSRPLPGLDPLCDRKPSRRPLDDPTRALRRMEPRRCAS